MHTSVNDGPAPESASFPEASDRKAILTARNLEIVYRANGRVTPALRDFSVDVSRGEFVSILGPSGCGKSTFLKVASGLLKPTAGEISLNGKIINGPRPDVGIVFQQATLMPWRTVLGNVLLPIRALKMDMAEGRRTAMSLLKMVGLESFAGHYPNELSGGMQQRVGIARGLVHDPALLLMDEPFAALDAMTREHMMRELQRIWIAAKKSVVFITHSIPEAVFLSDRIVVLSSRPGKLVREMIIDLPRPRTVASMADEKFIRYCNELRDLFEGLVKFD